MSNIPHVIIEKPAHGWSSITIQEGDSVIFSATFKGLLSYLDDILTMFLDTFITFLTTKTPVAIECEEEGSNFIIVILHDCIRVIVDRESTTVETFYIQAKDFIEETCEELNKNLDDWVRFTYLDESDEVNFARDKAFAMSKLETIKRKLKD